MEQLVWPSSRLFCGGNNKKSIIRTLSARSIGGVGRWGSCLVFKFFGYNCKILWSSYIPCSQIWHIYVIYVEECVHQLWHMTGFQLFCVNRDGCHMCCRAFSLFHSFGEFMISPIHYMYIHYIICQSKDYVYGLMTLVCLPGLVLTDLSWTYFMCSGNIVMRQNRYIWRRVAMFKKGSSPLICNIFSDVFRVFDIEQNKWLN